VGKGHSSLHGYQSVLSRLTSDVRRTVRRPIGKSGVNLKAWTSNKHGAAKYRIRLETPRLLLRPLIAADADWLADLRTDPEVNRFLADGALSPKAACQTAEAIVSLDRMKCQFGHWAIQDKGTGAVHGWTDLSKLRPWSGPSDEIALSYVLRRASWGQGIATEAAGRLLRCAFEVQQLDRVMAVMMAGNAVS